MDTKKLVSHLDFYERMETGQATFDFVNHFPIWCCKSESWFTFIQLELSLFFTNSVNFRLEC